MWSNVFCFYIKKDQASSNSRAKTKQARLINFELSFDLNFFFLNHLSKLSLIEPLDDGYM